MAKLTPDMINFIIQYKNNSSVISSASNISKALKEEFGIDVAPTTVYYHLSKHKDKLKINDFTYKNQPKPTEQKTKVKAKKVDNREVPILKRKTTKDFDDTVTDGIDISLFYDPIEE